MNELNRPWVILSDNWLHGNCGIFTLKQSRTKEYCDVLKLQNVMRPGATWAIKTVESAQTVLNNNILN